MCESRTPPEDTVIGSLYTPRPNLGPLVGRRTQRSSHSSTAVRRDRGNEPHHRDALTSARTGSNPASTIPADRHPSASDDATRVEAVPLHRGVDSLDLAPARRRGDMTPEDRQQEARAVADAVAEVSEGRLDFDMTAVRMAPTGTDDWHLPGHGPRPDLAVVASASAAAASTPAPSMAAPSSSASVDVASLVARPLVRPATASPLPRTDDELTPDGTLVRLNPILLTPKNETADEDTTINGTVVKLNPLLLVPEGAKADAAPKPAEDDRAPGLGPVAPPPYAEREPRPTLFGMPAPSVPTPRPPTKPAAAPAPTVALQARVIGAYSGEANVAPKTLSAPMGESLEIGSKPGSAFAGDPYVARYHAALIPGPNGVEVEDFGTTNGVYARVDGSVELPSGAMFRVGRQLLAFDALPSGPSTQPGGVRRFGSPDPGYWGRVRIMLDHERSASAIALRKPQSVVGREAGCTLAFPDDDQQAPQHCTIVRNGPGIRLDDAGTEHGTWVRLRPGQTMPYGTELLVGDTRVRLDRA